MSRTLNKPNALFWTIAAIALIWNGFGALSYIGQAYLTEETKATLTEAQLELIENRPAWATAAFAIAVFGGTLGALLMLLKKKLAFYLFVLSFIGVVVQMINDVFLSGTTGNYGPGEISMVILIPVIGVFLIYYTKKCHRKGWLS